MNREIESSELVANPQDNRDREENATIRTDTDEVSGSSDSSFSDIRPIRYNKDTDTWSEQLPTRQELVGIGVEKIAEKLWPFVEALIAENPDLETLVPQCLPIDPRIDPRINRKTQMKNTNSEKTNAMDNRDREVDVDLRTEAAEVYGSSDGSDPQLKTTDAEPSRASDS